MIRGNHDNAIGLDTDPRCSLAFRTIGRGNAGVHGIRIVFGSKAVPSRPSHYTEREVHGRVMLCHTMPSDPLLGIAARTILVGLKR